MKIDGKITKSNLEELISIIHSPEIGKNDMLSKTSVIELLEQFKEQFFG